MAAGVAGYCGEAAGGADEAGGEDVYGSAKGEVDPRVDAEKVTSQELPVLPERVILPMPACHRVAERSEEVPMSEAHRGRAHDAIGKGLAYLRGAQDGCGGWMVEVTAAPTDAPDRPSPIAVAVTALVVKGMLQADGEAHEGREVQRGLGFIRLARNEDGSYEGGALTNYVTSTVVSALAGLEDASNREAVDRGVGWLEGSQWDQSEGLSPRQDWFGGAGYGRRGRPDLSNTQMMLEALYDAGKSPDEPAFQKALAFLSRTQNLEATNGASWAGNDGGFVYTCANGGESMASEYAGEGRYGEKLPEGTARSLRSYGSMTYAGFKSLLYAGLSPDDERVRAAFDWIRRHWTLDENPGLGEQGLYYYYHAMARALRVAQQDRVADVEGRVHNWREELVEALVARQRADGRWENRADRWLEGEAVLSTAYAVLALEEALKPAGAGGE